MQVWIAYKVVISTWNATGFCGIMSDATSKCHWNSVMYWKIFIVGKDLKIIYREKVDFGIITVTADDLAPLGARPSAATVMT